MEVQGFLPGMVCIPVFRVFKIPQITRRGEQEQSRQDKVVPRLIVRWERPLSGWLKLNTDGSSRGNPGPSSYGGLVRDSAGRWVCGYMGKIGHSTMSLAAEIWAIFRGLCLIRQNGLQNVVVETDCQAALMLITVENLDEKHPQKAMIEECRIMLKERHAIMVHTYREGNHCADQLAKLGGWGTEDYAEMKRPPRCLIPFLVADAKGVGFERPPKQLS